MCITNLAGAKIQLSLPIAVKSKIDRKSLAKLAADAPLAKRDIIRNMRDNDRY